MDTKLTLSLDKVIIEEAKKYAKSHKISLSKLIESYLDSLIQDKSNDKDISPLVKSLSGVIEIPHNYNYKDDYASYLNKKYE